MKTLIHTGKLIGMVGNKVDKDVSVLINNGRFEKIGPQGSIAANGAREVDARNKVMIPGLFDLHFHLFLLLTGPVGGSSEVTHIRDEMVAAKVFHAANAAKIWLQTGVTTIRDAGAGQLLAVAMKEAIQAGLTPGPRVVASGPLIAQTGAFRPGSEDHGVEVTGADEARREARRQLKAGVDVLKLYGASTIGGGGGRLISEPGWTNSRSKR